LFQSQSLPRSYSQGPSESESHSLFESESGHPMFEAETETHSEPQSHSQSESESEFHTKPESQFRLILSQRLMSAILRLSLSISICDSLDPS
jgi:hypothetical protein